MKVEKKENNILYLELENEKNAYDIITSDDLFNNDLYYYHSIQDNWQYLYDAQNDIVYWLTDYHFNIFGILLSKDEIIDDDLVDNSINSVQSIELIPHLNDDDLYADYEWNTEFID